MSIGEPAQAFRRALQTIAFIGGGNMASAIVSGLAKSGPPAPDILVIDPSQANNGRWDGYQNVQAMTAPDASLTAAACVVWCLKPQDFKQAAADYRPLVGDALHISVMAGVTSDSIARAVGSKRVVRAMPNTPALIGQGICGLFARQEVTSAERSSVEAVLESTGQTMWVTAEQDLDAVTAISGSGPAYVFYFLEAMIQAAQELGLSEVQGRQLAFATFQGATSLASRSTGPPATLRKHVTSYRGTTHAGIDYLSSAGVQSTFMQAVKIAGRRAQELGDEVD